MTLTAIAIVLDEPPEGADRFGEFRVGLHHLAYHVPARTNLD
jgi:hypothetical protein